MISASTIVATGNLLVELVTPTVRVAAKIETFFNDFIIARTPYCTVARTVARTSHTIVDESYG